LPNDPRPEWAKEDREMEDRKPPLSEIESYFFTQPPTPLVWQAAGRVERNHLFPDDSFASYSAVT